MLDCFVFEKERKFKNTWHMQSLKIIKCLLDFNFKQIPAYYYY